VHRAAEAQGRKTLLPTRLLLGCALLGSSLRSERRFASAVVARGSCLAQGVMLAMLFELQALELESEPWLAMTSGSV